MMEMLQKKNSEFAHTRKTMRQVKRGQGSDSDILLSHWGAGHAEPRIIDKTRMAGKEAKSTMTLMEEERFLKMLPVSQTIT